MKTESLIQVTLGVLLGVSGSLAAPEETSGMALARQVTATVEFRQSIIGSFVGQVPTATGARLAEMLLPNEEGFWSVLESDLAAILDERIAADELAAMVESYGAHWGESGETLVQLAAVLGNQDTAFARELARLGCLVGLVAPQLDRAGAEAQAAGQAPEVSLELVESLGPVLGSVSSTCECVIDRVTEEYGPGFFGSRPTAPDPESEAFMQRLLTSGECPDPFAALVPAGSASEPAPP